MRFSLTTLLAAMGWTAVLAGTVFATIRLPSSQVSFPVTLVGFLVMGFLSLERRRETMKGR